MKKDESRFNIRFNLADPRHQKTMQVLNDAGRRKASLIVDAICEYLVRHDGTDAANEFLSGNITNDRELNSETKETAATSSKTIDDGIRKAVLDGMSIFLNR